MSALAICLKQMNHMVIGSDESNYFFTEERLNDNKIPIFIFNSRNIIKYSNYTFIISYAYNEKNNEEVKKILEKGYNYYYYSDFINEYFKNRIIGISGTHGKTTICTILKTLLNKENISYIIGDGNGKGNEKAKYLILEACEYKYHFINYDFEYLIINNIDYDHPDFYNDIDEVFTAFKKVSKKTKCLIVNNDDCNARKIKHSCRYTYGIKNKSFVNAKILQENSNGYIIKINIKENEYKFSLPFTGEHMLYNFLAAFTMYYLININRNNIELEVTDLLTKYIKPKRRMNEIILRNNNIIIDDYAHHPTEIQATYDSVKQKYKEYDITIIFQPHTYSRTIYLYKEFQKVFQDKEVYIMDTYRSREEKDELKDKIVEEIFKIFKKYEINEIKNILTKKSKQLVIFMGAGDIYREINDIKNA